MACGIVGRGLHRLLLAAALLGPAKAYAVDYLNVTVQPDRAVPSACFTFSTPLPRDKPGSFAPYVDVVPGVDHGLQPRGRDLCVAGLKHGQTYKVRLKAGLPAADGTGLPKDVSVDVAVPDREARVAFDASKTILPYAKGVGLPLQSVNVAKARVTVYRFGERAMAGQTFSDVFGQGLDGSTLGQVAERSTKVFEGTVDIATKPNQDVATALPIDGLLKTVQPGVYVAVAVKADSQPDESDDRATQWFSVSDIGLVTVKTDAGMLVSARSLKTAAPLADVDLRLVARSNEILASYRTGPDGLVIVPAGLLRGEGGDTVRMLTASSDRGDFTPLALDAPALDLGDLDIKGRMPPGPLDAFLWTDRGIYRPGETLHLGALLRDRDAHAVSKAPLTVHLMRPDGIEVDHFPVNLDRAGGGTLEIHIPDNAYSGDWTLWAGSAGKEQLGSTSVSVQDFVPPRLEAKLAVPAARLDAGGPIPVTVSADYFYGSPGAALGGQVDATVQPAEHPFPGLEAYRFGLVQEPFLPKALDPQSFTTDDKGVATVTFPSGDASDTTTPLEVALKLTVNDVDGRPATAELTKPLRSADHLIGIRPDQDGVGENADAGFDLVWLDGDGTPAGPAGAQWELVLEDYVYNSFFRDGRWQFEEAVHDTRITGGDVALGPDGHARHHGAMLRSGRYRLEVYAPDGKTASSLRFGAGWWAESLGRQPQARRTAGHRPDRRRAPTVSARPASNRRSRAGSWQCSTATASIRCRRSRCRKAAARP